MQKSKSRQIDMLHGPLAGKLVMFAMPLALSSILQQLFNSADLAVVGRFDSSTAMAAVGSNAALVNLFVSLLTGLAVGGNVVVATLIGNGQKEKINDAVHSIIGIAIISGLIVMVLGEIFAPQLLELMNTPDDVMRLAVLYLRIYFVAVPFIQVYNFGSSILRAKGDSSRPLYVLIASGLMNVVLNLYTVISLHMGVAGVATATVISNAFSTIVILWFLAREEEAFRFSFRKLHIHKEHLQNVLRIGAPAGLQGMVFSLSNVVIQSAINSFGADAIAGNTAGQNFEFMSYYVVNAFAQAATTFTSQNYGAQNADRCKKIYKLCMLLGLSITLGVSCVFILGRNLFLQMFTTDPKVIHYAVIRMLFVCWPELLTGTYEIPGGCMRGMGHSMQPAVLTILGSCVFRLIWIATIFRLHRTMETLLIVYMISWIITGTAVNISYFSLRKSLFAQMGKFGD